jgi:hypothetical protein
MSRKWQQVIPQKSFPECHCERICKQNGKDVCSSGLKKTLSPAAAAAAPSSIDLVALHNFTSCSIITIIRDICYLLP